MTDGIRCPNLHDGMAVVDEWRRDDVGVVRRGLSPRQPAPLTDMGRFSHEALMVDPETGIV